MGIRRRAREVALQILFHLEFNPGEPGEAFERIFQCFEVAESIRPFASNLVSGVCQEMPVLDQLINQASKNWRLERMPRLDKSILRIAVYEILFLDDIPPKVSMDEAVELGKKFGTEDSGSFINGILDHIYNNLDGLISRST
jgi:transcription antitermination factor NusB